MGTFLSWLRGFGRVNRVMCSKDLSLPLGATVGQAPTQLGKDGVFAERTLGGCGFWKEELCHLK